jgi:AcrR family transcriptional regulator
VVVSAKGAAGKTRRTRRSTAEVRHLVLESARALFAAEGYGGATTLRIAERAGVSETVLFRHFPTKERLFEAAVLEPFDDFVSGYTAAWADGPPADEPMEEIMRRYTEEVYEIVRANRPLIMALVSGELLERGLPDAFSRLEAMGEAVAATQGFSFDSRVAVRAGFMMVASVALMEEGLFAGARVSRERLIAEMTAILTGGLVYPRS